MPGQSSKQNKSKTDQYSKELIARGIDVGSFLENPNRHIDQIHMREGDAEGSARIVLHTEGTTDAYALDLKRGDNLLDKLNENIAGTMRELPDPTKIPSFKPRPKKVAQGAISGEQVAKEVERIGSDQGISDSTLSAIKKKTFVKKQFQ